MAVQAFKFYNLAKKYISGTINLGSTVLSLHLVKSTSSFATAAKSHWGSISNEVASGGNYKLSGKVMTKTWSNIGTASIRLNFTAISISASTNITSILGYVVVAVTGASAKDAANKVLGYASLTSAVFSVSSGNKLIINPSAHGLFELT